VHRRALVVCGAAIGAVLFTACGTSGSLRSQTSSSSPGGAPHGDGGTGTGTLSGSYTLSDMFPGGGTFTMRLETNTTCSQFGRYGDRGIPGSTTLPATLHIHFTDGGCRACTRVSDDRPGNGHVPHADRWLGHAYHR
jgi:hypothetical protein